MRLELYKGKVLVGEAVVLSEDNVVYHLWETLRTTRYTTLEELKKKFKTKVSKRA